MPDGFLATGRTHDATAAQPEPAMPEYTEINPFTGLPLMTEQVRLQQEIAARLKRDHQ